MGYTTSIPEPELERGDGAPPCEGLDVEAAAKQKRPGSEDEKQVTKSKVVEGEDKPEPKKTAAKTKSK